MSSSREFGALLLCGVLKLIYVGIHSLCRAGRSLAPGDDVTPLQMWIGQQAQWIDVLRPSAAALKRWTVSLIRTGKVGLFLSAMSVDEPSTDFSGPSKARTSIFIAVITHLKYGLPMTFVSRTS